MSTSHPARETRARPGVRKELYTPPRLTRHGSVEELTGKHPHPDAPINTDVATGSGIVPD